MVSNLETFKCPINYKHQGPHEVQKSAWQGKALTLKPFKTTNTSPANPRKKEETKNTQVNEQSTCVEIEDECKPVPNITWAVDKQSKHINETQCRRMKRWARGILKNPAWEVKQVKPTNQQFQTMKQCRIKQKNAQRKGCLGVFSMQREHFYFVEQFKEDKGSQN